MERGLAPFAGFALCAATVVLAACGADAPRGALAPGPVVGAPPAQLGVDPFYRKWIDADGIPVLASAAVDDRALGVAREVVEHMLAARPDVRAAMLSNHARVAVIAAAEVTLQLPEYRTLPNDRDWNKRSRGLGGTLERPLTSCGEENLLHLPGDRYHGENILVHEFAHAVHLLGLNTVDPAFDPLLRQTYARAKDEGLWKGTYAASNYEEYWAEGAQDWFDCNRTATPADGIHNEVHTRAQLAEYDPRLYALLGSVFGAARWSPE